MGKNKKGNSNIGRCLIKDRFGSKGKKVSDSMLHTAELNDGYDWGRLNLQSVTEESSFQEFLSTAELAGTEFQAEKLNVKFVNPKVGAGLLSTEEKRRVHLTHAEKKDLLKIPRRPKWDLNTSAEELQNKERLDFLEWRRTLALLQEEEGLLLTPYEKNLDFWRQLWRVVERSDVVVQILDARNPLLFRCEDLEKYVKEIKGKKMNMLLLNKADFLTTKQRHAWARYFDSLDLTAAFFSATMTADDEISEGKDEDLEEEEFEFHEADNDSEYETTEEEKLDENAVFVERVKNSSALLTREELVTLFKNLLPEGHPKVLEGITTIGLVGYPNVGKSSTINALLQHKKVSVSATPGKTKHFQTLYLDSELMLCDCPGLVMPSFICTKADMIVNGILPIDQMRDHVPPVNLVTSLIPRHVLQAEYGIMIPKPMEGEDENRPPTAEELLNAYGFARGFMTQNGQPDNPRSSRYILKDFVNGKLLYCYAPPGISQEEFHTFKVKKRAHIPEATAIANRAIKVNRVTAEDLDHVFFKQASLSAHSKGVQKYGSGSSFISNSYNTGSTTSLASVGTNEKPWKKHSEKRNKREKLRRIYRHLDE